MEEKRQINKGFIVRSEHSKIAKANSNNYIKRQAEARKDIEVAKKRMFEKVKWFDNKNILDSNKSDG